jgi:Fe-S oxidoreductase
MKAENTVDFQIKTGWNAISRMYNTYAAQFDMTMAIGYALLHIDKNGTFIEDNKSLLNDYISEEELRACTTCNACVEACPVSINPLDIILQMRRYLVMEKSIAPQEWTMMFGNIENNFAPWKFSPDQRADWAKNYKN